MKSLEENLEELRRGAFSVTATQTEQVPFTAQVTTGTSLQYITSGSVHTGGIIAGSGMVPLHIYTSDSALSQERINAMTIEELFTLVGKEPFIDHLLKFFKDFSTLMTETGFDGSTPEESLYFIKNLIYELQTLRIRALQNDSSQDDRRIETMGVYL